MKVRSGFVSNSSSSSFLMVGVPLNEVNLSEDELNKTGLDIDYFDDGDDGWVGKYFYVGEYECKEFMTKTIFDAVNEVEKKLGKEPRIYVGMRHD